ncbi:MAG: hypothetical protein WA950_07990, partial [Shinella sp.]|uniref:hypothetical protein n=1 Tax=Shinella sp. TaxID=1870904 RepID=UPI003C77D0BF
MALLSRGKTVRKDGPTREFPFSQGDPDVFTRKTVPSCQILPPGQDFWFGFGVRGLLRVGKLRYYCLKSVSC